MAYLLPQLLTESAAKFPERTSVIFKNRAITYAELERESNRLAHALIALKSEKGDRIGLYVDRGLESVIAACGVLKAGATYVPIDPASPPRRVSYIVEKCGIKTLLTARDKMTKIEKVFPERSPLEHIVMLDGIDQGPESFGRTSLIHYHSASDALGESAPDVNIIDSDAAYILFTSGSTGNPKGVMISHLNSLTFVKSAGGFFGIEKEDRLSNIAPLHFDMSVFDIFAALKAGAAIVVIPETTALFPISLAAYVSEKKISVWNSVPSALALLATCKNLAGYDFSSLRLILFAGEAFPLKYLRILQEAIPGARFCNMYGQTEANSSTYFWVERRRPEEKGALPIGKALPNFDVFALDENGHRLHRPGQEGEFYVRASSVALGYWNEPEKTQSAFVQNPLRPDLNERVYKTGDLVTQDHDGNYVFLGRRDHMIKSRGYRIEIGEIETILGNHPQIKNAVVVPIPDELIGNRLSVIIVPLDPTEISKDDVLRYCAAQLPKYMIPESVTFRDSLPTTSSGKIDRKKLSGT